jgi:hypothetical protein
LYKALTDLRLAAVGSSLSNGSQQLGVRDIRNKMFHDFLTLDRQEFDLLVISARMLLQSMRDIDICIGLNNEAFYEKQALAKIDSIVNRDMKMLNVDFFEREILERQRQDMLEELEKKHEQDMHGILHENEQLKSLLKLPRAGRKFDSFAICLVEDLQSDLTPGKRLFFAAFCILLSV